MRYAKLIDGALQYAPNPIRVDGRDIFTTDPTLYGYKPVVRPDPPEQEGYYAIPNGWEETETELIQKWRLEPVPTPEPSDLDRIEAQALYTALITDTLLEV